MTKTVLLPNGAKVPRGSEHHIAAMQAHIKSLEDQDAVHWKTRRSLLKDRAALERAIAAHHGKNVFGGDTADYCDVSYCKRRSAPPSPQKGGA